MTTIYGFKRPDGSVVVDTTCDTEYQAWGLASHIHAEAWSILVKDRGYRALPFTLDPDGSITPKE